jgi:hypothetical protein
MRKNKNAVPGVEARHGAQDASLKRLYSTPKTPAEQGNHTDVIAWLSAFDARLRSKQGVTRDEFRQAQELRQVLRAEGIDV